MTTIAVEQHSAQNESDFSKQPVIREDYRGIRSVQELFYPNYSNPGLSRSATLTGDEIHAAYEVVLKAYKANNDHRRVGSHQKQYECMQLLERMVAHQKTTTETIDKLVVDYKKVPLGVMINNIYVPIIFHPNTSMESIFKINKRLNYRKVSRKVDYDSYEQEYRQVTIDKLRSAIIQRTDFVRFLAEKLKIDSELPTDWLVELLFK